MTRHTEKELKLVLRLIGNEISRSDFLTAADLSANQAKDRSLAILASGLESRDPEAVEVGLVLGFSFGYAVPPLATLVSLLSADWHNVHEQLVDTIAKLAIPESMDVLAKAALATYSYRAFDDARSLKDKATRAIAKFESPASVAVLTRLAGAGVAHTAAQARRWLQWLNENAKDEAVRAAAGDALGALGGTR